MTGNFIVMDMDRTGAGEWKNWHGDWGLPFIWTSLHVFGGNMGFKGNLTEINAIPFEAPPLAPARPEYDPKTQAVGVGYVRVCPARSFSTSLLCSTLHHSLAGMLYETKERSVGIAVQYSTAAAAAVRSTNPQVVAWYITGCGCCWCCG